MFDFELVLPPGFTAQAKVGVRKEMASAINKRLSARVGSIRKAIGHMLAIKFNDTEVAMALRGQSATDLPAHFGLTDSQASALASDMEEIVRKSVQIISALTFIAGVIEIQAIEKTYTRFLNLPNASYISTNPRTGTAIEIPVMHWMLLDPFMDIGTGESAISNYKIMFSGEGGTIDAQIAKISRSGRAIMKKLAGGGVGYVLPDIIRGALGENFLEYTLSQPNVATEAAKIFIQRMQ